MQRKLSVRITKRARKDLNETAAYFGTESVALELRFLDSAEAALARIATIPEIGTQREYFHPHLINVRMWPIPDFPKILIFYRAAKNAIEVVRILHTSRDISKTKRSNQE